MQTDPGKAVKSEVSQRPVDARRIKQQHELVLMRCRFPGWDDGRDRRFTRLMRSPSFFTYD